MTRKHFVTMLTVLAILLLSVTMATAQGPRLLSNGICPPGNTYSSGCDVAAPLGEIDVIDVQRIAARWHTTGTYTEPYWSLTGNAGTDPAANFLGTTDNQPLIFKTNGTEVMRVDTTGNIGIRTTDPGTALEVESPHPGPLEILNSKSDSWATIQFEREGTAKASTAISPLDMYGGDAFVVGSNDGTWSDPLVIENGAPTGALYVQSGGNVGIGTTNPDHQLHIVNTEGDATMKLEPEISGNASLIDLASVERVYRIENDGGNFNIRDLNTEGNVARLNIQSSGNIGIGTTSPQSTLQVQGDYIQFPTISGGPPPNADCDEAAEAGRVVVRTDGSTNLYVCTGVTGWVGK